MNNSYYFSHDFSARTDPKIKRLIARHGMSGYGIYWALIEDLYINANALLLDYECIAYDMRTDIKIIKSVINDFDLFVIDAQNFGSLSVQRRLEERNSKSESARQSAFKRWNKDANALQTQSEGNAIKESKGKKVNKVKKEFIPPTYEEVLKYAEERKATEIAKKFFDYFNAGNWIDSEGKKVERWKQKFISWEGRNWNKNNNNGQANNTAIGQHTDIDYLNQ